MALPELIKNLLENGVHFGHRSKNWNPKMKKFIFGKKSGIYIVDVEKTSQKLKEAAQFLKNTAAQGGTILFVSTKRQAKEIIKKEAEAIKAPYVTERWVGGLLTNFATLKNRIKTYRDLHEKQKTGDFGLLLKKEIVRLNRTIAKMEKNFSGLVTMDKLPDAIFVIDPKKEMIAVKEAKKLRIPVVAIVDTDSDPEIIEYPIPGNDDALKSIRFLSTYLIDAVKAGINELEAHKKEAALLAEKAAEERAKEEAAIDPATIEVLEDTIMEKVEEDIGGKDRKRTKAKEE